jgi:hypothetical protein
VNTEDNINVADHRNDSITQWHTSQQIHSLATENPIHTNQESVSRLFCTEDDEGCPVDVGLSWMG